VAASRWRASQTNLKAPAVTSVNQRWPKQPLVSSGDPLLKRSTSPKERTPIVAKTRIPLSEAEERQRDLEIKLDLSTAQIGLTVRTTNCLEERGIFTVRDLLNTSPNDLLGITNFGEKTLEEVYQSLAKIGFNRKV